ncbi:MAG: hypothetical protein AB8I08_31560 [Sandaracinaceae bacterium]
MHRILPAILLLLPALAACGDDRSIDAGTVTDSGAILDTGPGDAGPACLLEWNSVQMSSVGGACGVSGDEGSQLCLELLVDADGNVSGIQPGANNDVGFDGMTELCLMGEVAGRCVPRLAGASEEHCAFGP